MTAEITPEMVELAVGIINDSLRGEDIPHQQLRTATETVRLFQAQERYTAHDIERRAMQPKASQAVKDLAAMTQDDLIRRQRELLAERPLKGPSA